MPRKGQKSGYTINCEYCGKEIYQTKTQYNRAKHHFCSNSCQKKFQHQELFEDRTCEICGDIFNVSKKSTQRFCSIKCQSKWQSTQIGDLNPRTNKIECLCDNCNSTIRIIPANYKRWTYHFCNDDCRKEWYSNVFSQSEEWVDASRIRGSELLKNREVTSNTKPQILINQLLDKMKISYINEETFKYYSVDNYLIDYNLIIEVMGDYWHSSPLKYDLDNLNEVQKNRIPKDKAKHTYIKNSYNIEILYLWESDIYNNIDMCKNLIYEYINNNGILKNYHSFNYNINNKEIDLNKKIIYPLFEQNNITNA